MTHPQLPTNSSAKLGQDTIYLCNFRVSVDGEWLCLKELGDLDGQDSSAGATVKGRLDGAHQRLLQAGGTNNYRNSWNGTEGLAGNQNHRKGNRFYDTSDDLLVGRNPPSTGPVNKRFSDSNWANFYCRCLGSVIWFSIHSSSSSSLHHYESIGLSES